MMISDLIKRLCWNYQFDFNERRWWALREYVQNPQNWVGLKRYLSFLYLMSLRRAESKKCSTTGSGQPDDCCKFEGKPNLPHGLAGIIIARNVRIGKNVTICQHVTIVQSNPAITTVIEDGVLIGAGAVIQNNSHIGKNVKIGCNAVVLNDVPDNCTVVGIPAKIIKRN